MQSESRQRFESLTAVQADHEARLRVLAERSDQQQGAMKTWKIVTSLAGLVLSAILAWFGFHPGGH